MAAKPKFLEVYELMEEDKWYLTKDLGAAAATMTALVNRGMAEATNTSPRKYRKLSNSLSIVLELLKTNTSEFFGLKKKNTPFGMLCTYKNGKILDCYGEPYSLTDLEEIRIGRKIYNTKGEFLRELPLNTYAPVTQMAE